MSLCDSVLVPAYWDGFNSKYFLVISLFWQWRFWFSFCYVSRYNQSWKLDLNLCGRELSTPSPGVFHARYVDELSGVLLLFIFFLTKPECCALFLACQWTRRAEKKFMFITNEPILSHKPVLWYSPLPELAVGNGNGDRLCNMGWKLHFSKSVLQYFFFRWFFLHIFLQKYLYFILLALEKMLITLVFKVCKFC